MKHSNEKIKREIEYAEENHQYLEEKRKHLKDLKQGSHERQVEKKKHSTNKMCCWMIFVVLCLAILVIIYFVRSIKTEIIDDYFNKKEQIEKILPQGKEEVKQGLEQGEQLIGETKENIENIQKKYDQAKDTIENVQEGYEKAKDTLEDIQDLKEKAEDFINPDSVEPESE